MSCNKMIPGENDTTYFYFSAWTTRKNKVDNDDRLHEENVHTLHLCAFRLLPLRQCSYSTVMGKVRKCNFQRLYVSPLKLFYSSWQTAGTRVRLTMASELHWGVLSLTRTKSWIPRRVKWWLFCLITRIDTDSPATWQSSWCKRKPHNESDYFLNLYLDFTN